MGVGYITPMAQIYKSFCVAFFKKRLLHLANLMPLNCHLALAGKKFR